MNALLLTLRTRNIVTFIGAAILFTGSRWLEYNTVEQRNFRKVVTNDEHEWRVRSENDV